MGSNGCEPVVLRLIGVRKNLLVTHSVPLGDLWLTGCWDCTGLYIVAAGFGWVCTVLMFSWCFPGFRVEWVKALLVNVCYGTAKSAEIVSRDMWVSTGQRFCCLGRIPRLSLNQHSLYVGAVRTDGAEIP